MSSDGPASMSGQRPVEEISLRSYFWGQEDQYNTAVQKFVEYINYLTGFTQDSATGEWKPDSSIQAIPVWKEIANLPLGTFKSAKCRSSGRKDGYA